MKFRIIKKGQRYIPQKRFFGMWFNQNRPESDPVLGFTFAAATYSTVQEAEKRLREIYEKHVSPVEHIKVIKEFEL